MDIDDNFDPLLECSASATKTIFSVLDKANVLHEAVSNVHALVYDRAFYKGFTEKDKDVLLRGLTAINNVCIVVEKELANLRLLCSTLERRIKREQTTNREEVW